MKVTFAFSYMLFRPGANIWKKNVLQTKRDCSSNQVNLQANKKQSYSVRLGVQIQSWMN